MSNVNEPQKHTHTGHRISSANLINISIKTMVRVQPVDLFKFKK